jgi:serine protease Do
MPSIGGMENTVRDAGTTRQFERAQTLRSSLARFVLVLTLGLALVPTSCVQPDQGRPWTGSEDPARIPSLAPVVQAVMPAVVHVSAVRRPSGASAEEETSAGLRRSRHRSADHGLPPPAALDELLPRFFALPEMTIRSTDSGLIIDPDGYIVTEHHIVENAETVTVTVQEKKRYYARIIGRDPKTDLALLKTNVDHRLPYVVWRDSDTARVGDWVMAIGNPFGLDTSVSSGIIIPPANRV